MTKVITYGTYDLLHYGHIRLLERAKELGDYLIVGVTSDDYDKTRGKINNQQTLMERVAAVEALGIADEVIAEEYEGQKIDDIIKYGIDIFTVGSDWEGKFDYLNEYCKVVYLDRTKGVSSTEIRSEGRKLRIGLAGNNESRILKKYYNECKFVNGAVVSAICSSDKEIVDEYKDKENVSVSDCYDAFLDECDAIYLISHPSDHYEQIKKAIAKKKHILVELPVTLSEKECNELYCLAKENNVILMPAMKTAYATAYNRLLLLVKSGKIGKVLSVDATCTSIREVDVQHGEHHRIWNSICAWGPTAMLPVFHILGTDYRKVNVSSYFLDEEKKFDLFSKIDFRYENAVATIKVGRGVKSEGELVISGTQGYIYVPAPWWKTDYFEVRYENSENNRRYFYQLNGEGIRNELVEFTKFVGEGKFAVNNIDENVASKISAVIEEFYNNNELIL